MSYANRQLKRNSWPQRAEEHKVPGVAVGPAAVRVPEVFRKPRAPGLGVPAKATAALSSLQRHKVWKGSRWF